MWSSCELISASYALTQSAEVLHWALHDVHSTYLAETVSSFLQAVACYSPHMQVFGRPLQAVNNVSLSIHHCLCGVIINITAFIWKLPFTCELISTICCLIQFAHIGLWAVCSSIEIRSAISSSLQGLKVCTEADTLELTGKLTYCS